MSPFRILVGMLAVSAFAADARLDEALRAAEAHYNHAGSLQVLFKEEYMPVGRPHRTEAGTLRLRKPGRMRWDYSSPAGKLIVSDGKTMWMYTPADNRAEKLPPLDQSGDMRAPLAFLLGNLHFQKEFSVIKGRPEGDSLRVTAGPKTENLPYSKVEFLIAPGGRIDEVTATGFDDAVYHFTFDQEKLNVLLDPALFHFEPPKGAEIVGSGN